MNSTIKNITQPQKAIEIKPEKEIMIQAKILFSKEKVEKIEKEIKSRKNNVIKSRTPFTATHNALLGRKIISIGELWEIANKNYGKPIKKEKLNNILQILQNNEMIKIIPFPLQENSQIEIYPLKIKFI